MRAHQHNARLRTAVNDDLALQPLPFQIALTSAGRRLSVLADPGGVLWHFQQPPKANKVA